MLEVTENQYIFPNEPSRFTPNDLERMLEFCVDNHASDVTIQSNDQIVVEIYGRLHRITRRPLSHPEVGELLNGIYGANGTALILGGNDIDTQHEIKPARGIRHRFRVNATGCLVEGAIGIQITLRTIPSDAPYVKDMGLEEGLIESLTPRQGIVVVAGATGSGKSTLLAAIIRELLEKKDGKILTYESPIEFVYDSVKKPRTSISQSEIPVNLPDFPSAIRNALRRKPTYILVGEARDKETISAVIDAALTGHTVYTTVHSNGVVDTMRRMVAAFPQEERYGRTVDLISLTRAIVWQMLVPNVEGKRAPLREWLVFSREIRNALLTTKF